MSGVLLRMADVSKSFGATRALAGVSLEARGGEVLALIGENGAGKSTLMKILSGAIAPDGGQMELAGQPYAPSGPHAARQAGVAMIYQELNLAPHLSAVENVMLGEELSSFGVIRAAAQRQRVRQALELLGRPDLPIDVPVGNLSVADQQVVEIVRALAIEAKVIVFDEPTSSLTQHDVECLFRVIEKLKRSGIAIIYISHFLEEVRRIADRYTVLRDGSAAGSGMLAGVTESQIIALMVGRSVDELFPSVPHTPGEVILSLDSLAGPVTPQSVSFELRRGEILGIAGLMGSGRTELVTTLFGEYGRITRGKIKMDGQEITIRNAREAMHHGISLVPEDRKRHGLVLIQSILRNISLANLDQFSSLFRINDTAELKASTEFAKSLAIKASNLNAQADSLSGGNQQKVVISKWLMSQPKVLIMDDPTRGIDVGTKYEIYKIMNDLSEKGIAIIMISSELEEVLGMSDRVMVMHEDRSVGTLDISEATEEKIMALATGVASQPIPER